MSKLTVGICGLARDIATVLPKTISRIEYTGGLFKQYSVIVVENDSADNTREILNSWATSNSRVRIEGEQRNDPVNPKTRCLSRATRMATYRNIYRSIVAATTDLDLVMVLDMDLAGGWSNHGIAHSISVMSSWDFIGANGLAHLSVDGKRPRFVYYDVWAFRHANSWKPLHRTKVNPLVCAVGSRLIHVNSCFGGLGLYRPEAIRSAVYGGTDCEHVVLHREMSDKGFSRTYMNPSQLVVY